MLSYQRAFRKSLAYNAAAQYTDEIPLGEGSHLVLTNEIVTHGFTGGSTPGVKFEPEVDMGDGAWVPVVTAQTTGNGALAAAVADQTLTAAGKGYRYYPYIVGTKLRVKLSVTGTPTAGTDVVNVTALVRG